MTTGSFFASAPAYFTALLPASMSASSHAPSSASGKFFSASQSRTAATAARTAENSHAASTRKEIRCSLRVAFMRESLCGKS